MKKLFAITLAIVAMASCAKNEPVKMQIENEMSFYGISKNATKGYVTGATFQEVVNPAAAEDATDRQMIISAYNETDGRDYFFEKTFKKDVSVWRNFEGAVLKPLYWPVGKDLTFLAYSQGSVQSAATWADARNVTLEVTPASTQDDILYASASGNSASSTSASGLAMTFDHAQAWIAINLKLATGSVEDVLTIRSLVWENIYSSGALSLSYGEDAVWNFFTQSPADVAMDDPYDVLDEALGSEDLALNMLIPAQNHSGLIINYEMNGMEGTIEIPSSELGTSAAWNMGGKYIYNLTFTVNEITFAPAVNVWTEESHDWPTV